MICLCEPELAVRDHRAERLDHDAHAEQRGDVGGVVGRRDLDHLEPAQALRRDQAEELQRLARQEAAGLRPAGAGDEAAIDANRRRRRCRPRRRPSRRARARSRRSSRGPASRCRRWSARWSGACAPPATPARGTCQPPMPSWTRFVGRHVRQVGRPVPGRRVHALVEILLLDVDVAVEMDDADPLRRALGDAAHAGKADRMIAAEHHRQRARGEDMRDAAADLVEALLEIAPGS